MPEGDGRLDFLKWSCESLASTVRGRFETIDVLERKAVQAFTVAAASALVASKVTKSPNATIVGLSILAVSSLVLCTATTARTIVVSDCQDVNAEVYKDADDGNSRSSSAARWEHVRGHLIDAEKAVRRVLEEKARWATWSQFCALITILASVVMVAAAILGTTTGGTR